MTRVKLDSAANTANPTINEGTRVVATKNGQNAVAEAIPETELAKHDGSTDARWSDAELRRLSQEANPFQAAMDAVAEQYGDVQEITDHLGNGFTVLDDKSKLIGKELIILHIGVNKSAFDPEDVFVSMACITREGGRYIVNDGSTGIRNQIKDLVAETGRWGGWRVPKGLRISQYTYENEKGQDVPAETFYIDTSAD